MTSCPNIAKNAIKKISPTKTVRQLIHQLQNPTISKTTNKRLKPELDVDLIRSQMKKKWRDPGYVNIQFAKAPILRAKLLTQWEHDQMYQAQRSYKYPKDFKGLKYDIHSRKFEDPPISQLPQKFIQYLDQVKEKHEEKLFSLDASFKNRKQRIKRMLTENSVQASSAKDYHRSGLFGFKTGMSRMSRKFKTVSNQ